ncbi:hypothetical protein HK101_008341 [Irineochytrium annulatum]|nr:hypothetical protein HK101_008341 [Irineochytrium annulatum]
MADNPRCFMDVVIGKESAGRIVFELFANEVPKTVENFRCLCTGERGRSPRTGIALHYKGAPFHRIIKDFMIQSGDFTHRDGTGGESIFPTTPFPDERLTRPHSEPFLLSMANKGKDTNSSQFFITTVKCPHLDGKHVVFGRVVSGAEVVRRVEGLAVDGEGKPFEEVIIGKCGELVKAVRPGGAAPAAVAASHSEKRAREEDDSDSSDDSSDDEEEKMRKKKKKEKKMKKREKKEKKRKKKEEDSAEEPEDGQMDEKADEPPEPEVINEIFLDPRLKIPEYRFLDRDYDPRKKRVGIVADDGKPAADRRPDRAAYVATGPREDRDGRVVKGRGPLKFGGGFRSDSYQPRDARSAGNGGPPVQIGQGRRFSNGGWVTGVGPPGDRFRGLGDRHRDERGRDERDRDDRWRDDRGRDDRDRDYRRRDYRDRDDRGGDDRARDDRDRDERPGKERGRDREPVDKSHLPDLRTMIRDREAKRTSEAGEDKKYSDGNGGFSIMGRAAKAKKEAGEADENRRENGKKGPDTSERFEVAFAIVLAVEVEVTVTIEDAFKVEVQEGLPIRCRRSKEAKKVANQVEVEVKIEIEEEEQNKEQEQDYHRRVGKEGATTKCSSDLQWHRPHSFKATPCLNEQVSPRIVPSLSRAVRPKARVRQQYEVTGTNVVYKGFPFHPDISPNASSAQWSFNQDDVNILASHGVTAIRLGIMWPGVEPFRGHYNTSYLAVMAEIVEMLQDAGIYVLLDFHQDALSEKFCGEGLPMWAAEPQGSLFNILGFPAPIEKPYATDSNGIPSPADCGKHGFGDYTITYAASTAYQRLYTNYDGLRDAWVTYWKIVAATFLNFNNILGYDLMNEPGPGNIFADPALILPGNADHELLEGFFSAGAEGIRSVDPNAIIFMGSITWDNFQIGFKSVPGGPAYASRTVLSFHHYEPPQLFDLNVTFVERMMDMTRFEMGWQNGNNVEAIRRKSAVAEKYFFSYTGWEYTDYVAITGTNNGLRDPSTGLVRPDMAAVYSRTYATAIAGDPTHTSFDDVSGNFTLTWTHDGTDNLTEIRLNSASHYPTGYTTGVTDGLRVVSRAAGGAGFVYVAADGSMDLTGEQVTVFIMRV